MIISIAWKNVWRNKTRSLVVIFAVAFGTIAGVFAGALMNAWIESRIQSVIYTEEAHINIHDTKYLENNDIQYTIDGNLELETYLNESKKVKSYTKRTKVTAMASSSRATIGLNLIGVNKADEIEVCDIYSNIPENAGTYLEEDGMIPSIVISDAMANDLYLKNFMITQEVLDSLEQQKVNTEVINKLKTIIDIRYINDKTFKVAVKEIITDKEDTKYGAKILNTSKYYNLGSNIVINFTNENEEIIYQSFQVTGVYDISNNMYEQKNAFVNKTSIDSLLAFNANRYHEVLIIMNEDYDIYEFTDELSAEFGSLSVVNWQKQAPDAGMMAGIMNIYQYIVMIIILLALAFGIINTMLMAILERIKELGMLMAIGMKKTKVFIMIMLETVFLTLTGSVVGMLIGGILIAITNKTGLNFSSASSGLESLGFDSFVYPYIGVDFFFGITFLVIMVGILSSIIPARKAIKNKPIDALRIE